MGEYPTSFTSEIKYGRHNGDFSKTLINTANIRENLFQTQKIWVTNHADRPVWENILVFI
jgi:diketogulonate reductase-like aldo/keto reductase